MAKTISTNSAESGKSGQDKVIPIKSRGKIGDSSTLAAALSGIGQSMLACTDYTTVAANAAALLSSLLGMSHIMVLRLLPAGNALLLQGGTGWKPDMIGRAVFDVEKNSLTGYTLSSAEPVVIDNLRMDARFTIPAVLQGHGLVSGICVRIPCQHQPFGVVAAFSTEPRAFSQEDSLCLRVIAGMLATSIGCQRTAEVRRDDQEKIIQAKQEWEATVDALPHFICLLDGQKRIVRTNRSVEKWISGHVTEVRGRTIHELLHPRCTDPACYMQTCCDQAWDAVRNGETVNFDAEDRVLIRHLNIQLRPISLQPDTDGVKGTSLAVVVLRDITSIKRAEALLKNYSDELELRILARTSELREANELLRNEIDERRRIEEALRHSENEMHLLSAQLMTAQEMERKRIASELHDGLGQSLSAIKFCMENAIGLWTPRCGDQDIKLIESIIPKMQGAIDEVRRISMDLRPSTLDDLGVIPTIAWFCREFRSIYRGIQLDTFIDIQEDQVSMPRKTVIYRVLQEALNNVAKHAKADRVRIHLRKNDSAIELLIQDNGMGFDLVSLAMRQESERGFGIAGMRERSEFSGGTFTIKSTRETGTIIRVMWPCPG